MDGVTKRLLEFVGNEGYIVGIGFEEGRPFVTAYDLKTEHRYVFRAETVYEAALELANSVGVGFEKG